MIVAGESGDFCVAGAGPGRVAGGNDTAATVVAGAGVFCVAGSFSTIVNVVDPVTSIVIPETFTRYSSGLNVDASIADDQRLYPSVPGKTVIVPVEPEKPFPCTFCVGLNDDE